ncbi:MAG: nucleotidyltransferase domain-containing protein [Candidatus Riesia sp.]|nr:nucleotidyltransferase domain-containing protein [Candidatus Riesia sp.]
MSLISNLFSKKLLQPPAWLPSNTHYETVMGSEAYGVSQNSSDIDIYGFCIPPKETIFPHLGGEILGFGTPKTRFEQYQQHHIKDETTGKEYDISIYNIVKYFQLAMENNPNMLDSLFTPEYCVRHCTRVGRIVLDHRHLFPHKGCYHKFRGYAYSQLHKMKIKQPKEGSKRYEDVQKFGWDRKFGYHVVRLATEAEQLLETGTLVLDQNKGMLKAIRAGEWTEEQVRQFFTDKEKHLEKLYETSKLPEYPDEEAIKTLLLNCLEEHYGNLNNCVAVSSRAEELVKRIKFLIESKGY